MNDLEEDEMRNLDVTEMEQEFPTQQLIDKDGFQMILSKSKKKSQKKLNRLTREMYSTRSKVTSKPSQ